MKKIVKIIGKILLCIIALLLVLVLAIQLSPVQNWLAGLATSKLSRALGTEVRVKNVSVSLFDKINLEGILIRDQKKDTLLYAGALRVRINDWFFLKDKTELKYIGLEDATIKLKRTTAVWNYEYIIDHFASPSNPKSKKKGVILDLKKIDLKNISFVQNDQWRGETISANVGGLLLDAKKIDLAKSSFAINSLFVEKPRVLLEDFDGLRPDSIKQKDNAKPSKPTEFRFNPGIWLSVDSFRIQDGSFATNLDKDKPLPHFDGTHLKITQLTGSLNNLSFNNDTLKANVDLACKERCGFDLKKLKTHLRITPQIIELAKLDLQTNKSHLADYYAMRFKHFSSDFKEYVTEVTMDAKFKESKVFSDDIAYFAPALKSWKKDATISGSFLGTVANFNVKKLFIRSGGTTSIAGDLSMKGLPYINTTVINFTSGTIKTNSKDMAVVIPDLKEVNQPNLTALGTVFFRGNFNGTIRNFATKGIISSNIGAVDADVKMFFPNKAEPTYTGTVVTQRFNLGKFLNNTQLGLIDFKGKVSGSSFNMSKINTNLDGFFSNLEYNGYNYTNITTNASIISNFFKGEVKIDDPNLDFTSTIEINFDKDLPRFNMFGDLVKSNFKNLKLTNDSVQLTGLLDLNFVGKNIDDFLGTAKILNANLVHEGDKLSFDSLILNTQNVNGEKLLTLASNEFSMAISGKSYKLLDLPTSFQTYLSHYYPAYFPPPNVVPVNQDFKVSLFTKDFDKYAAIIDKRLGGLDYATIVGSINTSQNKFDIQANIPTLRFGKYHVADATVIGEGTIDTLKITSDITNIRIGDSLNFPNTNINITSSNDYSDIAIRAKADNTLNAASLNAGLYTLEDGVRISFNPSSFILNDKKWDLEKKGEIVIRKNFVSAENVKFTQGLQEIKVETEPANDEGNANNLILKLKDIVVGDMTSLFMKNPQFEGLANGEIRLNDFYGAFNATANIKAEQFRMDVDSIGLVNLSASYSNQSGVVGFKAKSPNKNYNFNTEGTYSIKDSTGQALYVNTQLGNTKISLVQRFLGDLFSDMSGVATGNLIVKGNPNSPDLLGSVKLSNGGLKIIYTQVYYTIDSATINFEPDGINLGTIIVKDRYKNTGVVKGKIYEKGFKNMAFDLGLTTNKLLMLDTKAKDNKQFYGKAIGKADLTFKGPESNAYLQLTAESNDSSHIYIPNSQSKESGEADFIEFKKYGKEMLAEKKKTNFDLTVDLDLAANNNVKIDVILDELTGDVIKAVGNGRLRIIAGTTAPLSIKGRYNIDRGSYDFNFQSFIRKPFELLAGAGNFIEWTGDPLKADLHIDAKYTADRVSINDLLSNQQASVNSATKSYRGEVYVIASLRDKLSKPTITFSLDFPQGSPVKTDAVFGDFIARIEADQNEMLSQATSLIVFGSFAPYGQGVLAGGGANNLNNFGVNTISQLVTKQVNKVVSNLLYKLTGDKSLRFDLGTSVYSSSSILDQSSGLTASTSSSHLDRTNVTFKVGKSFFNDNVIVTFGGDLDFNLGNTSTVANGNFQWLPDLNVELVLSQDKRLRAIVFSKNSLDISGSTLGRRNRQGVSLSYKRDFDHFWLSKPKEIHPPLRDTTVANVP
ncbi:translocation/assembly module TamB domain-containing protein [Parasediminibacterium sp. JCM 36343]|uniref:translocation/assembly module TamB domain-containing protein n=1 Tax=Parasediminibacterium sp. JCM 36343 TaxID=3374279 RepID=UPI00397D7A5C